MLGRPKWSVEWLRGELTTGSNHRGRLQAGSLFQSGIPDTRGITTDPTPEAGCLVDTGVVFIPAAVVFKEVAPKTPATETRELYGNCKGSKFGPVRTAVVKVSDKRDDMMKEEEKRGREGGGGGGINTKPSLLAFSIVLCS